VELIIAIAIIVAIVLFARYADRQHPGSPSPPRQQELPSQPRPPSTSTSTRNGSGWTPASQSAARTAPTEVVPSGRLIHTPVPVFKHDSVRSLPNSTTVYKSEYNRSAFNFTFCKIGSRYRAYIRSQPSYRGRPTGANDTHRLTDPSGNRYVCIEPEPTSMDEMLTVTRWWAECTSYYIERGTFPDPQTMRSILTQRGRN
jgi:hypothetical protein